MAPLLDRAGFRLVCVGDLHACVDGSRSLRVSRERGEQSAERLPFLALTIREAVETLEAAEAFTRHSEMFVPRAGPSPQSGEALRVRAWQRGGRGPGVRRQAEPTPYGKWPCRQGVASLAPTLRCPQPSSGFHSCRAIASPQSDEVLQARSGHCGRAGARWDGKLRQLSPTCGPKPTVTGKA